jgi:hypothetical protein
LRPKTYSLAVYLVIGIGVLQLAALLSVFYFRRVVVKVDTVAPPLVVATQPEVVAPPVFDPSVALSGHRGLQPVRPLRGTSFPRVASPAPGPAPAAAVSPSPASLVRLPLERERGLDAAALRELMALNEEAEELIRAGGESNWNKASGVLAKAELKEPNFPPTIRNEALLAEARKKLEEARKYWQKLNDLGPDAGDDYVLAKEKLAVVAMAIARAKDESRSAEGLVASGGAAAPSGSPPTRPVTSMARPDGLRPFLFIGTIEKILASLGSDGQFSLRIEIGTDGKADDLSRVGLELWFYERNAEGAIVPSAASIQSSFEGDQRTWSQLARGFLSADYHLEAPAGDRAYYGYIVRVSYDGKLADQRAEPASLLQFFPSNRN